MNRNLNRFVDFLGRAINVARLRFPEAAAGAGGKNRKRRAGAVLFLTALVVIPLAVMAIIYW